MQPAAAAAARAPREGAARSGTTGGRRRGVCGRGVITSTPAASPEAAVAGYSIVLVRKCGGGGGSAAGAQARRPHGRAVQVDPIKPKLKAPGTKRLKLKRDEPLSNFAFKINLRRYTMDVTAGLAARSGLELSDRILPIAVVHLVPPPDGYEAGTYTRSLFSST